MPNTVFIGDLLWFPPKGETFEGPWDLRQKKQAIQAVRDVKNVRVVEGDYWLDDKKMHGIFFQGPRGAAIEVSELGFYVYSVVHRRPVDVDDEEPGYHPIGWFADLNRAGINLRKQGSVRTSRKIELMPQTVRRSLPPLRSQEHEDDPIAYVYYFNPYGQGTWVGFEFDGVDEFFGAVNLGHGWEMGYFSLSELKNRKAVIFGKTHPNIQGIERDKYFTPKPFSQIKAGRVGSRLKRLAGQLVFSR